MSVAAPEVNETTRQPLGLDRVLISLQDGFNSLGWLEGNVYLRAYEHTFAGVNGRTESTPKVYIGNGEYMQVFINDNLPCALFFRAESAEDVQYEKPSRSFPKFQRKLSLIFWGNMTRLDLPDKGDYIFTEPIKDMFIDILKRNPHVFRIDQYEDDNIQAVFSGYNLPTNKDWSKWPYISLRIDFTVLYNMREC